MGERHLEYEKREDDILFFLSDHVRVSVKHNSRTKVEVQMWRLDALLPPDVGNMNSASFRSRLVREAEGRFGPVPTLEEELGRVATALRGRIDEEGAESKTLGEALCGLRAPSALERLVGYGEQEELFRDPEGEPHATVRVGEHRETYHLRSRAYKNWLRQKFYAEEKSTLREGQSPEVPRANALSEAIAQLEARCHFEGAEHEIHVRLAEHEGKIYLDLANERWEAVEIAPEGWRVIADPPVKFIRPKGMLPLPTPTRGEGGAKKLRGLLNLTEDDEDGWRLILAWLVAALRPGRPVPVLVLQGEQGSAKSTAQRILRALVDPSTAPLRTTPKTEHDLYLAAANSWVMAFDNLSHLRPWLADALCKLATGGGFVTRRLYEDREQELFDALRPIVLSSITDIVTRPDLLDRSIIVTLPPIAESERRPESEVWEAFREERPEILGFVLNAISAALRGLPDTKLENLARMADFCLWVTAAEEALGWERGSFARIYDENRGDAHRQALEASPVAVAIYKLVRRIGEWNGTPTQLLTTLTNEAGEDAKRSMGWPAAANALSNGINRLAPALRAIGIRAEYYREPTAERRRMWRLSRIEEAGEGPSRPSEAS